MKLPNSATEAASIANRLRDWYVNANTRGSRAVVPQQIVNPALCQEVLDRIGPSLERHKGCVLIDLNPGVSLWSQYLHEFLKPRTHILVEHQRELFAPHLDPLLKRPDSRYRWTDDPLEDIFDRQLQGLYTPLSENQRYLTENPQILVNASFSKQTVRINRRLLTNGGSNFLNDLYASLYGLRSDLFRYGLFRALVWVPDEHKHFVLPRTVDRQSKQSIQFAMSSNVTEVAGSQMSTELVLYKTRNYGLLVEDMQAMRRKEEASGIVTPEHRLHKVPVRPFEYLHPSIRTWAREEYIDPPYFFPELRNMDRQIKRDRPHVYQLFAPHWEDLSRKRTPRMSMELNRDPNVKKWRVLYSRARRRHSALLAKLRDVDEQRSIDQAWRAAEAENDTATLTDLAPRELASRKRIQNEPGNDAPWVRKALDDYRAYDNSALSWHRRPYNPLAVSSLDFATGHTTETDKTFALLDVQPSPQFRKSFDTHIATRSLELVLTRLTTAMAIDIRTALAQIVPGAVDEFIATVPSLKDSTKGGWFDLDELRVRTLPPEMWAEMALAYYNWPFRLDEQRLWHELTIRKALKRSEGRW